MSEMQEKVIDGLAEQLGVPAAASRHGALGLTNGQAASLIDTLVEERELGAQRDAAWFAKAVTDAQEDVPIVGIEDDEGIEGEERVPEIVDVRVKVEEGEIGVKIEDDT